MASFGYGPPGSLPISDDGDISAPGNEQSASNSFAFGQQVDTNVVFEFASNDFGMANTAENNVEQPSGANSFTFGQQVTVVVERSLSASNSMAMAASATSENTLSVSASNSYAMANTVALAPKLGVASNDFAFGQTPTVNFERSLFTSNQMQMLEPNVSATIERSVSASNSFGLVNSNDINFIVLALTNTFTFGNTATAELVLVRALTNIFTLEHLAKNTTDATASNDFSMANACFPTGVGEVSFAIGNTASAEVHAGPSNSFSFGQTVSVEVELGVSASNSLTLSQTPIGWIEDTCDLHEYTPFGSGLPAAESLSVNTVFEMVCDATTLTLPNPQFGNADEIEPRVVNNVSRGGSINIFRDAIWPNNRTHRYTIPLITDTKRTELFSFLKLCLGKEITVTDHEDRTYTGIILNPDNAVATNRNDSCGQYTASLEILRT